MDLPLLAPPIALHDDLPQLQVEVVPFSEVDARPIRHDRIGADVRREPILRLRDWAVSADVQSVGRA